MIDATLFERVKMLGAISPRRAKVATWTPIEMSNAHTPLTKSENNPTPNESIIRATGFFSVT